MDFEQFYNQLLNLSPVDAAKIINSDEGKKLFTDEFVLSLSSDKLSKLKDHINPTLTNIPCSGKYYAISILNHTEDYLFMKHMMSFIGYMQRVNAEIDLETENGETEVCKKYFERLVERSFSFNPNRHLKTESNKKLKLDFNKGEKIKTKIPEINWHLAKEQIFSMKRFNDLFQEEIHETIINSMEIIPEAEYSIIIYDHFPTMEEANKFMTKHSGSKKEKLPIYIIKSDQKPTLIMRSSETEVKFLGDNSNIINNMYDKVVKDHDLRKEMEKNRVKKTKQQNIDEYGPDDEELTRDAIGILSKKDERITNIPPVITNEEKKQMAEKYNKKTEKNRKKREKQKEKKRQHSDETLSNKSLLSKISNLSDIKMEQEENSTAEFSLVENSTAEFSTNKNSSNETSTDEISSVETSTNNLIDELLINKPNVNELSNEILNSQQNLINSMSDFESEENPLFTEKFEKYQREQLLSKEPSEVDLLLSKLKKLSPAERRQFEISLKEKKLEEELKEGDSVILKTFDISSDKCEVKYEKIRVGPIDIISDK